MQIAHMPATATQSIIEQWEQATYIDNSLTINAKMMALLLTKQIVVDHFARSKLFSRMQVCEPSLHSNFPIWLNGSRPNLRLNETDVLNEIRSGIPQTTRARVRNSRSARYLPISKVVSRWSCRKAIFNVTDLHYIRTRFDARMNTTALNDFNLLSRGSHGYQSQDSLVISAGGTFTDSHSDDHAGSNHCFVGEKLWLMWDTAEGLEHGLEDVERCSVFDRARFDMNEFIHMNSSRWLVIGPGQTMFIPTNMTHKVVTLKHYLGLGAFHLGFPNFIDSLLHWAKLPPYWANRPARYEQYPVELVVRRAIKKLNDLNHAKYSERVHWGIPFLKMRLKRFWSENEMKSPLSKDINVQTFIRATNDM